MVYSVKSARKIGQDASLDGPLRFDVKVRVPVPQRILAHGRCVQLRHCSGRGAIGLRPRILLLLPWHRSDAESYTHTSSYELVHSERFENIVGSGLLVCIRCRQRTGRKLQSCSRPAASYSTGWASLPTPTADLRIQAHKPALGWPWTGAVALLCKEERGRIQAHVC